MSVLENIIINDEKKSFTENNVFRMSINDIIELWSKTIVDPRYTSCVKEEEAKKCLEQNIKVAFTFIQELYNLFENVPAPRYGCEENGSVYFRWDFIGEFYLNLTIRYNNGSHYVNIIKSVFDENCNDTFGFNMGVDHTVKKITDRVVKMLKDYYYHD